MNASYAGRLVCLALASFFILHTVLAVIAALCSKPALAFARRLQPVNAARLLLTFRLTPAAASLATVALLFLPSYLRFEPQLAEEEIGVICLAAAALALWSIASGLKRVIEGLKHTSNLLTGAQPTVVNDTEIWLVNNSAPVVAIAGIVNQRIVISNGISCALSPDELTAALLHERAHRASADNLKRMLIAAVPHWRAFHRIESEWERVTEWAADDTAVAGSEQRSVALAAALVHVAQLGAVPLPAFASPLVSKDLETRVQRLLTGAPPQRVSSSPLLLGLITLATIALLLIRLSQQPAIHTALEHLLD